MESERIGDMTRTELEAFVLEVLTRRRSQHPYVPQSDRSVKDILQSMRRHRLEIRPGEPSTLELLREDRDR